MKTNLKIKIEKVSVNAIQMLQLELEHFVTFLSDKHLKTDFLNAIIALDISLSLYYVLQKKIDTARPRATLTLSISQSAIITKCANYNRAERDNYARMKMQYFANEIDRQFKNFV